MIRVPPDTERAVLESAFRVNADHKLRDRFQIVLWAARVHANKRESPKDATRRTRLNKTGRATYNRLFDALGDLKQSIRNSLFDFQKLRHRVAHPRWLPRTADTDSLTRPVNVTIDSAPGLPSAGEQIRSAKLHVFRKLERPWN